MRRLLLVALLAGAGVLIVPSPAGATDITICRGGQPLAVHVTPEWQADPGDVVPPYDFGGGLSSPGQGDQRLLTNGCLPLTCTQDETVCPPPSTSTTSSTTTTSTTTPPPTEPPIVPPTVKPHVDPCESTGTCGEPLPDTGADNDFLFAYGLAALLSGGTMVWLRRRAG